MAEMMLASRPSREASIISAIPVVQEACYEPTCSPPPYVLMC